MKLLLFSDLHCSAEKARQLVERSRDVDVVVGAGDFANARQGLEGTIAELKAIERPTVLVCGNAESEQELAAACSGWPTATVLHGTGTEIRGLPFFGLGGAVPVTPFGDWSYDLTEEQAAGLLRDCPPRAVLVCHSPPLGVLDADSRGRQLGSTAVRTAIETTRPRLVVCGHIHASGGKSAQLGETPIVNAGPDGVVWELEEATE